MGRPRVARRLRVFRDLEAASAVLASRIAAHARLAVRRRGRFVLVLSGGSTPQALYRRLARFGPRTFPWRATEVFFGDERCVGPRSAESNYAAARRALLAHVPVPARRVHRIEGERGARAARDYAERIGPIGSRSPPRFDLVLLGVGPDGHTASLFPGRPAMRERRRSVVPVPRAGCPPWVPRITLTLPALASAREVAFLVAGAEKATAVRDAWAARSSRTPPSGRVTARGRVDWYVDRAAASQVRPAARRTR